MIKSEARLNFTTGTTRAVLLAVLAITITCSAIFLDLSSVNSISIQGKEFLESGAATWELTNKNTISPVRCDNLSKIDGILHSGAISEENMTITPISMPGTSIPVNTVSQDFYKLLDLTSLDLSTPGIFIPTVISERLGIRAGDSFLTKSGEIFVSGVYNYPDDGRQGSLGFAALAPLDERASPNRLLDSCQATIWGQNDSLKTMLWTALESKEESANSRVKPEIAQLNGKFGITFEGVKLYDSRDTKYLGVLVLLVCTLLGFVFIRIRRLEIASWLHVSMKKSDALKISLLEIAPIIFLALITSIPTFLFAYIGADSSDTLTYIFLAARIFLASAIGLLFGTTLGIVATKERHLFKYFKER
ncbi:MAG: hypothetical protein LBL41_03845 [Bifidobacteriaceae bacterium]|jgi:hypothetical protein|nr:hypothetical protein [Bifidobacteriaceae bacterium]